MGNVIVIVILIAMIGFAISIIIHQKRKGKNCIGCPSTDYCKRKSCNGNKETK